MKNDFTLTRLHTNELCWFISALIDEKFESLTQRIREFFIVLETITNDNIHFIFKVQQILHHALILFRIYYNGATLFLKCYKIISLRI